ncbi:MAG TPA: hotdog domain-containing protein [Candidatus Eremiobacteraceae bacterium]|jgi:predicted thioesterase
MHRLRIGMRSSHSYSADPERLADHYGNAGVPVLATPHLVRLLETECLACVAGALDDGCATVGTRIDIRHLAATPSGMRFELTAELTEIDRRRLVFTVNARDEVELIMSGTHERFVVETAVFLANAAAKRSSRTV